MHTIGADESRQTYLAAVLSILILLLAFSSRFLPEGRLWGIDHLSYFTLAFALVVTAVGVLGCILAVLLGRLPRRTEGAAKARAPHAWGLALIIAVLAASAALFWFIKPATYLLGDQQLQIHELSIDVIAPRKEIGTVLAYTGLYRLLRAAWDLKVPEVYAILGCLSGVVFILLLRRLLLLLGFRGTDLIFSALVVLAAAPVIFFFGYTENYTLLYVATLAYLCTSFLAMEKRVSLRVPLILLILAIFFHHIGALLIPSFILLSAHAASKGRHPTRRELTLVTSCALFILLIAYIFIRRTPGPGIFIPPFENKPFPGYVLLSRAHLLDILNVLLLLCPAGLILLLSHVFTRRRNRQKSSARFMFACLASLFPLLFLLTAEPELGVARDWDIFAFSGLTVNFLAITAMASLRQKNRRFSPVLHSAALTAVLLLIPWLLVNTDEQR
ncbi:MAG: hypothetical protein ACE5JA_07960, partial [bacterium]